MNAIPSNCIVTKLDRQQMQGNDVMSLLYFDINLYRRNISIIPYHLQSVDDMTFIVTYFTE